MTTDKVQKAYGHCQNGNIFPGHFSLWYKITGIERILEEILPVATVQCKVHKHTFPKTSHVQGIKLSPVNCIRFCDRSMIKIMNFCMFTGKLYQFMAYVMNPIDDTRTFVWFAEWQNRIGQSNDANMQSTSNTNTTKSNLDCKKNNYIEKMGNSLILQNRVYR